jgi:hypothetical protein
MTTPNSSRDPMPFSFSGCNLSVGVHTSTKMGKPTGEFTVELTFCPGSDEMWESLSLATIFTNRVEAEQIVAAIKAARKIDLRFWTWYSSKASPFACFQVPSAAVVTRR